MEKIVLISCVKRKLSYQTKARDLYISPMFKKSLAYAQKMNPDKIFILSAKYELVELEEEIQPYELTLNDMPVIEIKMWAEKVIGQLVKKTNIKEDHFIILAGAKYRKYLIPHLSHFTVPLEGMPIGKQMKQMG